MPMPKQYVAFELLRDEEGDVIDVFPIREGLIVELGPRPGVDPDGTVRYGQVLPSGELVQTFSKTELIVCPVLSNG